MSGVPAEAVAAAYGLGEPVGAAVYAARGELGRIWRLDTRRGSWAVKELLVPVREGDARADVAFQIAAAEAGVRLPRPVLTGGGDVVAGGRWRVYEWVDLVEGAQVTAAELGAVTAGLHGIGRPAAGPVAAWFAEPVGRAGWEALAAAAASDDGAGGDGGAAIDGRAGENAGWREALRESVGELVALDELVVPPDPAAVVTCHRDITPDNIRRAAHDGGIVVLDWENCGPASPAWELAKVLADLPEGAATPAYRAYRDAGGPGRVTEPADFSMAIAEQGHLLEFYARRAMNPEESEENRTRAGARLRAMLARPLTRDRVERLVEECTRVDVPAP
ncbi:aminoglycoside phosphotransferase family protein [Nonomuraea sp. LP-02]|uniref:aminoglycoside phosphotransferase family protein n=1 Tax=Nonomuraea sp. LP-02 TaxID=3097960 RepID=UPI002E3249D9|nr:aminoglycoside phosphotransferase family protein [Nonomuraea sp. LP-02]MED7923288.1 aminoglycoside phosphotransferase family protein [Nonomuraea sp. LP-02]